MSIVVLAPSMPSLFGATKNEASCTISWACAQAGVVGYAVTGAGLGLVSPILVSYTGKVRLPNMTSTGQIGGLTVGSYLGVILGPLFFGELSMVLGALRWALLVGVIITTLIPCLASITFEDASTISTHLEQKIRHNRQSLETTNPLEDRKQGHQGLRVHIPREASTDRDDSITHEVTGIASDNWYIGADFAPRSSSNSL